MKALTLFLNSSSKLIQMSIMNGRGIYAETRRKGGAVNARMRSVDSLILRF